MTTSNWATDNRYGPNNSGATAPLDSPAAYSARWIDKGDFLPADVLPDRQGFAYNHKAAKEALIMMMGKAGDGFRIPHAVGLDRRDQVTVVMNTPYWKAYMRRAGGYIYVDAWLVPDDSVVWSRPEEPPVEVKPQDPTRTHEHDPLCDDDGWDHPGPCVLDDPPIIAAIDDQVSAFLVKSVAEAVATERPFKQYLVTVFEPGNITDDPRNIHTILTSTDNIQPRDRVTVEVYVP